MIYFCCEEKRRSAVRAYQLRYPDGLFVELAKLAEARLCRPERTVTMIERLPEAKPQAPVSEYAPRPAPQGLDAHGRTAQSAPAPPEDHLDIPAFLRRQST